MARIDQNTDMATQVAVLATKMQQVEDTLTQGIKDVKSFTDKSISKEQEVALKVQDIAKTLQCLLDAVAKLGKDIEDHKTSLDKRIRTNEHKAHIALVWLAFLTVFEFALLLFIASGSDGAKVAGEFTGGLVKTIKP